MGVLLWSIDVEGIIVPLALGELNMEHQTIAQLMEERDALERRIAEAQRVARSEAVAKVKSLMADYGLTVMDLTGSQRGTKDARRSAVAAKYRDPVSGQTWSGRGLKPRWLSAALADGKRLEDFRFLAPTSGD